ncbi:trypsin-like peptidase domain-containing protein [Candidatus Magnetominusculus xianensis]|uniref:Magnetosome protein MamE n=1 Tax=Candidatus Magnetominusculus xianensis TaxID=1748249 RepID=A0ABR5SJN9_9BACT|nr:trypsin-like peptidase domain-containing protein [Candidatus Magnetominusculus xianensis]KWT94838.1 magnetosome protein MamE [Candidatus Magnetominusculus xianensis]MBF0404730.1 trypsin-like peptidase domain-containing protein [Nitrospirota bacterium]
MAETRNDYKQNDPRGFSPQQPQVNCPRSFKPWIWTLCLLATVTLGWTLFESYREGGIVKNLIETDDIKKMINNKMAGKVVPNKYYNTVAGPAAVASTVQDSYHNIIETVRPSLVSIDVVINSTQPMDPAPAAGGQMQTVPNLVAGLPVVNYTRVGSGVIVEPTGFVLTSFHVIEGAASFKGTVYGAGGAKEYPMKLVNVDKSTDLALLRIDGEGPFPTAVLGDSDGVRSGDVVLAMGSPFGFDQTITSGIISGRNRSISIGGKIYEGMFQTDTPINKGNSGGPLVNASGEVIGINTAIYSPTGSFSGIAFSIPVNLASTLVAGVVDFNGAPAQAAAGQIAAWSRQGRQVGNAFKLPSGQMLQPPHQYRGRCIDCHPQLCPTRQQAGGAVAGAIAIAGVQQTADPFFGAVLLDVDTVVAKQFNLAHAGGILVDTVFPGTPADTAGIKRGDIIMRLDGQRVLTVADFKNMLAAKKVGGKFDVMMLSGGQRKTVKLKTGPYPPQLPQLPQAKQPKEFEWLGGEISPLLTALQGYTTGVYVADTGGVLAAAGVARGDVIRSVNNQPVKDMLTFIKVAQKANPVDGILLDIVRSGHPMFITVKG